LGEPFDPTDPNQQEVPFNLEVLRKHLAQLALARRVLPDDATTRQKLLEDSVYEEASERLKRQAEIFDKLGLGDGSLKGSHLQRWMWDWHQKLQKRLEIEIADVIRKEESIGKPLILRVQHNAERNALYQSIARPTLVWARSFPLFLRTDSPLSPSSN
jgi:hypothetical protein